MRSAWPGASATVRPPPGQLRATSTGAEGASRSFSRRPTSTEPSPPGRGTVSVTADPGPTPGFEYSPTAPLTDDTISFRSTSSPSHGSIAATAWDLDGDGAFDDASGTEVTWSYATAGDHLVQMLVTQANGSTAVAFAHVDVAQRPASPPVEPASPGPTGPAGPTLPSAPVLPGPTAKRPVTMRPLPTIRIAGVVLRDGALIRILSVRAPRGATVRVRCSGKGCPAAATARTSATRLVRFRRFEREAARRREARAVRTAGREGRQVHALPDSGRQAAGARRPLPHARHTATRSLRVSRRAMIAIAAVDAAIAAFVIVGLAVAGDSSSEPQAKATQVSLSQTAEVPGLKEDPAVVARRRERARAARQASAARARRAGRCLQARCDPPKGQRRPSRSRLRRRSPLPSLPQCPRRPRRPLLPRRPRRPHRPSTTPDDAGREEAPSPRGRRGASRAGASTHLACAQAGSGDTAVDEAADNARGDRSRGRRGRRGRRVRRCARSRGRPLCRRHAEDSGAAPRDHRLGAPGRRAG